MRFILFCLLTVIAPGAIAQGFLKADGERIIDERGKEILLRGMGLGGWMLQEPYMLKLSGAAAAQYDIRNKMTTLIGEEKTATFYDTWLNNHCTKADIDTLAAWGFNSVRLPMHFNLFTLPVEKEPVKGKSTWLVKGFQLTDSLLSWCKANKIYLILDLHAAPGGQGNDNAISDRNEALPSLWQSQENRDKTIAIWQQLASRYKDEPWIGAYDLVNEPNWGFTDPSDRNGCSEKENKPLRSLLVDITKAIRAIDKKHMIIIEGNCWGNNYDGFFPLWDNNIVLSFHKYWNYNNTAAIQKYLDLRQKYKVPIWLGETGENSNAWFTDVISLIEKNKIGWAMWPLKKAGLNNPVQLKINDNAKAVFDYWESKSPKPEVSIAFEALLQLARNTNIRNCIIHHDVVDAMMRQTTSAKTAPYRANDISLSDIIYATDYDMGRSGEAYHDKDSAEYWVSTNHRTPWNTGGSYRNDGVDIEACSDKVTNGFNVGWFQTGEWLQYSIYAPAASTYNVHLRSSSNVQDAKLTLLVNGKKMPTVEIPSTGAFQHWTTNTIRSVQLAKGWNRIRVLASNGGFNLNYLQFIATGNTAIAN